MEGKIVASALRIVLDGCDQGRKVRKFFFVPQVLKELNSRQFTVWVDLAIEQMHFEHEPTGLCHGGPHAQAGYAGQWIGSLAVRANDVNARSQRALLRCMNVQRG